jgi:hypothetical protein
MPQLGTTQIGEYQIGEGTPQSVSINTTTLFLSDEQTTVDTQFTANVPVDVLNLSDTTPVIDTRYEIDASVTELTISDEDSTAEYIALGDIYEITGEWNTDYLLTGEW